MRVTDVPKQFYGVLLREQPTSAMDEAAEQVRTLGYAVLDAGYSKAGLEALSEEFDQARKRYIDRFGESELRRIDEFHTVRSPLTHGGEAFIQLALNPNLLDVLGQLIIGKYILNQQNGIINPPREEFSQGRWHRDLPYQHFVSTRPLAVNALFCMDEFTAENGATYVLPGSHKSEAFPSQAYIERNAVQVEAPAGSFILLDCMLFHAGGFNRSSRARRAVNHVYTIPYFKQQINIPKNISGRGLSDQAKNILGFDHVEPSSISDYFAQRVARG